VTFPPGRSRLATIPLAKGSVSKSRATIGMALVALRTAPIPDEAAAKMASGFRWTKSAAMDASRSPVVLGTEPQW